MKYSKQLTRWQRRRAWGAFTVITTALKLKRYNNSFEVFCKKTDIR